MLFGISKASSNPQIWIAQDFNDNKKPDFQTIKELDKIQNQSKLNASTDSYTFNIKYPDGRAMGDLMILDPVFSFGDKAEAIRKEKQTVVDLEGFFKTQNLLHIATKVEGFDEKAFNFLIKMVLGIPPKSPVPDKFKVIFKLTIDKQ